MAVGNIGAIRDWMEDTWHNKEEIMDIFCRIGADYITWDKHYRDKASQGIVLGNPGGRLYYKVNDGPAYVACTIIYPQYNSLRTPVFVSKDKDAVIYGTNWDGSVFNNRGSINYNGNIWYYSGTDYGLYGSVYLPPELCLPNTSYSTIEDAALALLKVVYEVYPCFTYD